MHKFVGDHPSEKEIKELINADLLVIRPDSVYNAPVHCSKQS